jgi:hypothetical protein
MNRLLCAIVVFIAFGAHAEDKPLMHCGPFTIASSDDGFAHINGQRPETQKFTFLGKKDDFLMLSINGCFPKKHRALGRHGLYQA